MDRTERFYKIDRLLREHGVVPLKWFLEELEVSRATFKRDLEYMRDRLNAPIEYDRGAGGYRLGEVRGESPVPYLLPGVWFNAEECLALLTLWRLVDELEPRLLAPHLEPLRGRLEAILGSHAPIEEVLKRIRLLPMARRRHRLRHFEVCATAVTQRRQLHLVYYVRARDEETRRTVSPQRLVYYRDNWYLDAWCHQVEGLRSFAVDAIQEAEQLEAAARDVPGGELDAVLGAGYGIFNGPARAVARLRFSPERARWVSRELWHPAQVGRFEPSGHYILELPYADSRELAMDVLRHGPEVEVLAPESLRTEVVRALERARQLYP